MMENQSVKMETEYEEIRELETSEIDKLTDDCLIEIFLRLQTIADKIRIERVCKRWKCLSQRSWNNFQSLDFLAKTWGVEVVCPYPKLIRTLDFDKIIRLSGKYLTSISTDVGKFIEICHLLPKIQGLHLIDDCIHEKNCSLLRPSPCSYDAWQLVECWLMSHGENITNFKIDVNHSLFQEEDFASLIGNMKQLKSFYLHNRVRLGWSGTFLLELPLETIQEIILTSDYFLHWDYNLLLTVIQKCKKLQTLGIDLETCREHEILELLPPHATSLKNLKLRLGVSWIRQPLSLFLSAMSSLTNLEKLYLSESYCLNDEYLEVVAKNCKKLTYLNFGGLDKVTDRGISSICNLENLTYLRIGYIQGRHNSPLEKLKSLVVLDLSSLVIQEECLCTFLREAHHLRALSVESYSSVSNKVMNAAIEVAQTRQSNNALDLYIRKTKKYMDDLDDKPPFLNIIDSYDIPLSKYGIRDPFSIERPVVRVIRKFYKNDIFIEQT